MVKLVDFFSLIRFKNLLIIALSQYLVRYALIIPMTDSRSLSDLQFFYLVLSTLFIAAAGYIINDYFDTQVDRLNERKVIIDNTIKRREAILLHFVLSGIGVFLGFYLGWRVGIANLGFINLFSSTALWFYSTNMKKGYLSGNIIISLLAALTLFIVPMYEIIPNPEVNGQSAFYLICFYSIFAFVTTFIREIIKDFEDQFGDSKMGYNTFAIVSAKTAKITVQTISILLILSIAVISYFQIQYDGLYAAIYVWLSIELPLIYFFIKLRNANDKKTYHQLSQLIKLIMLTGTLSILVFTLLF
ncbi:MAG: geranylgeranylglycerol-phosphate geranylgeranyltransferase [Flavobacteriales bacterium]|nr:geranylgeranylglycerol-phosphate geranylgeranyltransferase [Flavobacteriales bacterium]MBL6873259.1 geranylgeranylglycerol-phosphate geranylgeranyltransferase [Flavobacteriales bacterium]